MALRFLMLGPPEIRTAAGLVLVHDARLSALFTALAVNANTPVSLDRLADALWEERPPSAAAQIRTAVSALRQSMCTAGAAPDDASVLWRRGGCLLSVGQDELDLDRFTLLFRQGRAALDASDHQAAAYLMGEALTTWRGAAGAGCAAFGWLRDRLSDLDELRWSAAEGRLLALLRLGRTDRAVAEARALLDADPLYEPWWACLIAGLRDGGEPGAARAAHDQARQVYIDEYGAVPDHVRRTLHLALLPGRLRGANWVPSHHDVPGAGQAVRHHDSGKG